ncbi:MAG: amidase [Proteobacteria bacterium]|nr:amidase [Pseudomonadota bacterium]
MKLLSAKITLLISLSTVLIGCSLTGEFKLEEASISDIHHAFETGATNCERLVGEYIARIEKYDQPTKLNAITRVNPRALSLAKGLDEQYRSTGTLRRLHCIPLIVKDNYDVEGLPTTAGSLILKDNIAKSDAYQVRKLKEAGAIVLARSNMAEWAFSPRVTISSTAGETRNSFSLEHVPAGSSGGTASAVSANFGAVGLGTDTGNSIRGPSSHNALVGFRSTLGLTSRSGIVPLYQRNDVGGPMARSVADATRILEVIAGYDPDDAVTQNSRGRIPSSYTQFLDKNGLKGARIGILRTLSEKDVDPEIHALFEQAINDLRAAGAEIIDPFEVPDFDDLRENQWCPMFRYDINRYLATLGDDAPVKNLAEILNSGLYSDYIKEDLEYLMTASDSPQQHEDGSSCADPYTDKSRIAFRYAIEQMMNHHDVGAIIYPSWNNPPARVGDWDGYKGDNSQAIAPHTGQPAFTVPMGYVTGNLPAGLQFLGRMFDEPTLIKYAYAYEQATRYRKLPGILGGEF